MDIKREFENIMKGQGEIALATSTNDIPNVRIVSFFYCEETKALFFSSFKIKKSNKTVYDVKEIFVSKNPKMEFIIDNFGDVLLLFEIPLSEVTVTLENQEVHTLVL